MSVIGFAVPFLTLPKSRRSSNDCSRLEGRMMILDVALGIVLGVVLLVVGFSALGWIVDWWSDHWEHALLFGIPLGLLLYAAVTDNPDGIGWSGLLLIGAILLEVWKQHKEETRARKRGEKEARKWREGGYDPGAWETHEHRRQMKRRGTL